MNRKGFEVRLGLNVLRGFEGRDRTFQHVRCWVWANWCSVLNGRAKRGDHLRVSFFLFFFSSQFVGRLSCQTLGIRTLKSRGMIAMARRRFNVQLTVIRRGGSKVLPLTPLAACGWLVTTAHYLIMRLSSYHISSWLRPTGQVEMWWVDRRTEVQPNKYWGEENRSRLKGTSFWPDQPKKLKCGGRMKERLLIRTNIRLDGENQHGSKVTNF